MIISFYYPNTRTELWYDRPEVLPSLTEKYQSYLPSETVTLQYPWASEKTKCPVNAKTTDAWTAKQRRRASRAPVIDNLPELADYVGYHICLCLHI